MESLPIGEMAKIGMTFERNRLELASLRLAQANVVYSSEAEAMSAANKLTSQVFSNALSRETSLFGEMIKQSPSVSISSGVS